LKLPSTRSGSSARSSSPTLDGLSGEVAEQARRIYCGAIGAEFMHLPEPKRRGWIAERVEAQPSEVNRKKILERLIRADLFEQVFAIPLSRPPNAFLLKASPR